MSGHSKWSTIKHKKGKTDAQRGKVFTKILREITTAARIGSGDPAGNPRLRLAIDKARENNVPNNNIERAIAKGTGEGAEAALEEVIYEGYAPQGVAIMLEAITDNKNRTTSEIRHLLAKGGGSLGETGCVSWVFKRKGILTFERGAVDEDKLGMQAIDAGAQDINLEESVLEVLTKPEDFEKVRDALKQKGFIPTSTEVSRFPESSVKLTGEDAHRVLKLVKELEEHDDVQAVHANFDIPDEIIEEEVK